MSQTPLNTQLLSKSEGLTNSSNASLCNNDKAIKNKTTNNSTEFDNESTIDLNFPDSSHTSNSYHSSFRDYIPLICISVVILLFLLIFSTIFGIININNNKIIEGISINGIDISGLTSEEATQKLSEEFSKKLDNNLTLNSNEYSSDFIPSQDIDVKFDISLAIETAYSIGRSGNLVQNNYEILGTLIATKQININLLYDSQKLHNYVDRLSVELPGLVEHPSYYIENNNLIIVRGHSGIELLQDKTKQLIISNIEYLSNYNSIALPTHEVSPNSIDINKIHEEIYSEPQNAYVVQEPFEVYIGSAGRDFSISLDEATNLLIEEKDEYVIPLKFIEPEVQVKDLGNDIFIHTLGSFTSNYKESNVNRSTNVKLASDKINNVILLPGEEFSYNQVVGKRTFENGFREASIYTSAGVVNGLGGGICQVSSTLYNAVLRANLEIVERRNHSYAVSYVPLGTDATVSYGSIDFRFKNNRTYPIKIIASSTNGICSVSITGIQESVEYEVEITPKKLQTIPFQTKYIDDSSLPAGTQKQTQYGDNGYKYETYKTLKLNGNIISSELISTDNYKPLNRIVRRGI